MDLQIALLVLILVNLLINHVEATKPKKDEGSVCDDGIMVAVFTPFENEIDCSWDCKINPSVIGDYAKVLASKGVAKVLVNGLSGEGMSLTLSESKIILKTWIKEAKPLGIQVFVEVGLLCTPDIFEMVRFAVEIGVDAITVVPPSIYKAHTAQKAVADLKLLAQYAKDTPIFFYDSELSGVKVNLFEMFPLATASIPNFAGIICDLEKALQMTAYGVNIKKEQCLIISKHSSLRATFELGFNISISAAYNILPELVVGVQNAKDKETAIARHDEFNKIITQLANPRSYIGFLKAACGIIYGIDLGGVRPFISSVIQYEQRRDMSNKLKNLGVQLKNPVE